MENVIFKLKEPQANVPKNKQKKTLVYLFFHFGFYEYLNNGNKRYKPLKYSTGLKILPYYWNDKPIYRTKQTKNFAYEDFNTTLNNIENVIINLHRKLKNDGNTPTPEKLRHELNILLGKGIQAGKMNLVSFADTIINESINGTRLTKKGKRISPLTIKGYKTTLNHLKKYQEEVNKEVDIDSVGLKFYKHFTEYFNQKNYSTNTIGKNIKNVKVFLKEAHKRGITKNQDFLDEDFRVIEEETEKIYLNDSELKKIYKLNLANNKRLEKVRDLFIVGCYTGLRFSDLKQIKSQNFIKNETHLKIKTQKTGELVIIPLHSTIKEIIRKYNGELPPPISNQKMNKYLKDIGENAKIDNLESTSITKGGMRVDKTYKKYKLITVHTARRSFATNMYLNDIPSISIMKITGHKTEKAFLRYIRISQEDNARKLAEHPYFKQKSDLKIV